MALSLCLQVPVFENYYLCLGYVVMAVYCYSVGIISGTLVGTFGTILYCILISGLRGMPGWALGNIVIGIIMGYSFGIGKVFDKNSKRQYLFFIAGILVGTSIGILFVKSGLECLLYTQPFIARVASNGYAFIADLVVLLASIPVCKILDPHIKKIIK